jgi:hypothetical protein
MHLLNPIKNFYGRFERPISSLSLVLGFVFDIVTLKRVDTLWENIWILGHLVIIGIFIILVHLKESGAGDEGDPAKRHFWYVNILQFFFGGVLSAYLVFYFRSADILATWPFVFILFLAFWANESLKKHYMRLGFQISLFFLSIYAFAIFLVPIIMHKIGGDVFIFSGCLSLTIILFFILIMSHFVKEKMVKSQKIVVTSVLGIFALVNLLYFFNLIPPIPLSLKDAGVYYSINKNSNGNYEATYEKKDWWNYLDLYPVFNKPDNTPVYVFSAIFSPRNLNLTIVHEWQYYDEIKEEWITRSTIRLPVTGGRDGGFRTYSMKNNTENGRWRVNIKTEDEKLIGRVRFEVLEVENVPNIIFTEK